jgi:hypothetical protein
MKDGDIRSVSSGSFVGRDISQKIGIDFQLTMFGPVSRTVLAFPPPI